jgi:DNA helicase-2/ATP-dependent DNA helicase PcrA
MDEINYITSLCKKYQDKKIAILYRNRTHKNHLEFELKKKNIKYIVNDFLEITDRSAIKSILSILKIVSQHFDEYDLFQAAKVLKKLGNKTIVNLIDRTKKNNTSLFSQYMLDILDDKLCKRFQSLTELTDFYNRNENSPLNFLVSEIEKYFIPSCDYQKDMRDFILDITKDYKIEYTSIFELCNELGLNGKKENEDKDANIELSTVHGFKGNQAHTTIVPWVHQYQEIKDKEYNINDERRLFYVAITRAESSLYISYSGLKPRFIKEMGL